MRHYFLLAQKAKYFLKFVRSAYSGKESIKRDCPTGSPLKF